MTGLLDGAATAERLGLAPRTLAEWRRQGRGPTFLKVGRKVYYRPAAVDAYLASREVSSTAVYGPCGERIGA